MALAWVTMGFEGMGKQVGPVAYTAQHPYPLIVGGDVAGLSQGSVADGLISQIDLFPPFCHWPVWLIPAGGASVTRGFSAMLTDPAKVVRDHVLIEQEETRACGRPIG